MDPVPDLKDERDVNPAEPEKRVSSRTEAERPV